jgi:hypothetical protein
MALDVKDDILPANFTISEAAKAAIEVMRADYDAAFPDNPAAVPAVGWAYVNLNSGVQYERVFVSFYQRDQYAEIAHGIQEVSGVKLIFFTTEEHHPKFNDKVLDHAPGRGFFLREP